MSEKLTVAELLARNAKEGGRASSERTRRRRSIDEGGVSVSDMTGSFPAVKIGDEDSDSAGGTKGSARVHHGHEAGPVETAPPAPAPAPAVQNRAAAAIIVPDSLLEPALSAAQGAKDEQENTRERPDRIERPGRTERPGRSIPAVVRKIADVPEPVEVPKSAQVRESASPVEDAQDTVVAEIPVVSNSVESVETAEPAEPVTTAELATMAASAGPGEKADSAAPAVPAAPAVSVESAEPVETADVADSAEPVDVPEPISDIESVDDVSDDAFAENADEADESIDTPASSKEVLEYEDDTISWPALVFQSALAVVVGVLIFFGFTLVWDNFDTFLALALSLVVTFVCVGIVHALLRHRDTLILVLTFIVGIALTVGPRLIMSI